MPSLWWSIPYPAPERTPRHIWRQGPPPYARGALPDNMTALCGLVLREGGRFTMTSFVSAEYLWHVPDEETPICSACTRELALHPVPHHECDDTCEPWRVVDPPAEIAS